MSTAREIIRRRKSVSNIRKITKTMEMIATARFKKAHDRAVGARPYTEQITQLVETLAAGAKAEHPLLKVNDQSRRTVLLALTSNRGLCGGYNGNVIRLAFHQVEKLRKNEQQVELHVSGKKGQQAFRYKKYELAGSYNHFDDKTTYEAAEKLADEFIELYTRGEIDAVEVVYTRFVSSAKHYADVLQLLPLSGLVEQEQEEKKNETTSTDMSFYDFYPSAQEILQELIPATVRVRLFQCFIDAIVSEQVARMSAMKAATDNAEQMISALTRQYNRARQSQITGELLDIMGGVEALK